MEENVGNKKAPMQSKKAEKKESLLYVLKSSRKAFIPEYVCGFFLVGLTGFVHINTALPEFVKYTVGGFGLFALASAEVSRIMTRYKVSNTKLTIVHGLIKQNRKNVYFQPLAFIPDLNCKQSKMQRFLGIGTIYLQSGASSFEIKDVDKPQEIMGMVEKMVEMNKPH